MKKKILDIFNFNTIVPIPTQFNKDLTINFNAIKKHIYLLKKKMYPFFTWVNQLVSWKD